MKIRPATRDDHASIWTILRPVIRAGETYTLPMDMDEMDAIRYWTSPDRHVFVAEDQHDLVGTYYIRANQLGGGSHVANCGYMTLKTAQGRGVARAMCEHSLIEARRQGFLAMQYNFVVSTNVRAVDLWQGMGFQKAGLLPLAFRRPAGDYVDAFVMFRHL
ncbi:MAG: GNAT family N-acetyltransferase [Proteobacteria bacterium]|nr:GNAT family N-acetyltransferase [Pseudomonadota bacterium]